MAYSTTINSKLYILDTNLLKPHKQSFEEFLTFYIFFYNFLLKPVGKRSVFFLSDWLRIRRGSSIPFEVYDSKIHVLGENKRDWNISSCPENI